MKKILTAIILIIGMNVSAQTKAYDVSKDAKNSELVFNGPVTFDDLNKEPSFNWLKTGHDEYKPDLKTEGFLKDRLKDYAIVVFLGTWCDDSHYLIPKLKKVLDVCGYPLTQVTMYGADREKTTKNGEHKKYGITLVPTVILYKGEKEVGRITESAQKSVENDLALMVESDIKK